MKIAVISDIHGNMDALDAVITDMSSQECEKICVLGDYAMAGPEPKRTINWFMSKANDENYYMIQGNTDVMIANYSDELYNTVKEAAPIMAEALKDDVTLIDAVQKEFLKNLPVHLELEEQGIKILLVHGSPRKNNEDIFPDTTMEEVEEMLEFVDAQVIFCGHTHIPCGFQTTTKQTVINVGSVGRPMTQDRPEACWLCLTIEDGKCVFEHRFVKYDKETASEKIKKRNFEGADTLAEMLLNPEQRHF